MKNMLAIFRKAEAVKADDAQSRLAAALVPPPVIAPVVARDPTPPAAAPDRDPMPAKLVFAFDATGSREAAWKTSTALTMEVLSVLPGQLQVGLAVHGGSKLHTFTGFETDAAKLRKRVAAVRCEVGTTRLLDILERTLACEGVSTLVYVGDVYEESEGRGRKLAAKLAARGIRIIILHDNEGRFEVPIFNEIAALTGGAVLPFDVSALPRLRELLAAVAVLAVGGVELLAAKQKSLPGAQLLLEHVGANTPIKRPPQR